MTKIHFNLFFTFIFISSLLLSCEKKNTNDPCVKKVWYADADLDGLGDKSKNIEDCKAPAGYVSNADDDNDDPNKPILIPTKGYVTPVNYSNLKAVWADEFEGATLNDKNWNYELGNNSGWGNNELQNYRKENTTVKDGFLIIQAKKELFESQNYTSSRLTTQNKVNLKYGRIDIRAALPKGQGIWPALWMLGKNINTVGWPKCGEIDIMEMIGGSETGRDNTTHGTVHWSNGNNAASYGGSTKLASGIFNDEFHVFSLTWDEKKIIWYLDDKKFHEIDITPTELNELQEEFFFVINLAVGGNWPGSPNATTIFPQQLVVDYIRVFQ